MTVGSPDGASSAAKQPIENDDGPLTGIENVKPPEWGGVGCPCVRGGLVADGSNSPCSDPPGCAVGVAYVAVADHACWRNSRPVWLSHRFRAPRHGRRLHLAARARSDAGACRLRVACHRSGGWLMRIASLGLGGGYCPPSFMACSARTVRSAANLHGCRPARVVGSASTMVR